LKGLNANILGQLSSLVEETKMAKEMSHPVVIQIFGVTVIEGNVFLVMEFCDKGSLLSWLHTNEGENASILVLLNLAKQMAKSILYLQNKNCLHRKQSFFFSFVNNS
jgi:serine/threonine protein kinase